MMTKTIACGTCHGRHDTVPEAKACAEKRHGGFSEEQTALPVPRGPKPSQQRHDEDRAKLISDVNALQRQIPAGRYAVIGENGKLNFYHIDKPVSGRWHGYVFLKRQDGPNFESVRALKPKLTILAQIAADPKEAALTYGREIGSCCRCGLELTNPASRARGMGDKCAGVSGWF